MKIKLSLTIHINRDQPQTEPESAESDTDGPRIWDMSNGHHERAAQHNHDPEPVRLGFQPHT